MACSQQNNQRFRNLDTVRILAQKAANMLQVDMKIYKTICDGVQIFKFSEDWSGTTVETVQFSREYSSESVLPDNEDWRNLATKSIEPKSGRRSSKINMDKPS